MSALKAGDLVFVGGGPAVGDSEAAVAPLVYLREATSAECEAAEVAAPASWLSRWDGTRFRWATIGATDPNLRPQIYPDASIVGAVHTGIDSDLILPI